MKIIELIHREGAFEEYRIELSEEERSNKVDARTFRALGIVEHIRGRYGIFAAVFATLTLAIWSDIKW